MNDGRLRSTSEMLAEHVMFVETPPVGTGWLQPACNALSQTSLGSSRRHSQHVLMSNEPAIIHGKKVNRGWLGANSRITLTAFVEGEYLPWTKEERRASTSKGNHENLDQSHSRTRRRHTSREFRNRDASRMLRAIARDELFHKDDIATYQIGF